MLSDLHEAKTRFNIQQFYYYKKLNYHTFYAKSFDFAEKARYQTSIERKAAMNSELTQGPWYAPGKLMTMVTSGFTAEVSSPLRLAFRRAAYPSSSYKATL